jgi:acetyl esterase/lipase
MSLVKKLVIGALVLGCFPMALFLYPVTVLNAIASVGHYEMRSGIPYAEGDRQTLDVYLPSKSDKPAPVVVFFYGGSWDQGDKSIYRFVGAALATRGFIAIIPDYRLYPEVRFPGFLEDGAKAVGWAHSQAAALGGDPGQIFLMGHSAGAHIAAMLTFDPQWLAAVGLDPSRNIKAMIGLAGPYDFLPLHSERLKDIFGPEDRLAATQPINFVTANAPPVFLGAAEEDSFVKPRNTARLADRIVQKGGPQPTVKFYPHVNHLTLIGAFSLPLRWLAPVLYDITEFIRKMTDSPSSAETLTGFVREPA